jgi:hypothetical protein
MRARLRVTPALIIGLVAVQLLAPSSRADLVIMNDGTSYAGRVVDDQPTTMLLKTGDFLRQVSITLSRSDIRQVFRDVDEVQELGRCEDPAQLQTWSAGYFQAGDEPLAGQCVRRAWKLSPAIGDEPLGRGSKAFKAFWNREILKEKESVIAASKSGSFAALARWAHDAGLEGVAASYLRQGWSLDRNAAEILTLARDWRVSLESAIRIDLKPCLQTNLFVRMIRDQGENVQALADHVFLMIPLRYDIGSEKVVLSKSTVLGKSRRGYYGVRPLQDTTDLLPAQTFNDEPMYERLELRVKQGARSQLILRNNFGPRHAVGQTLVQEHLRVQSQTKRASGLALFVVEVPEKARSVALAWDDGGRETIDLDFLRGVRESARDSRRVAPDSREAVGLLRRLDESAGATAELALAHLSQLRDRVEPKGLEAWSSVIEKRIIAAGTRIEEQVRSAAWAYFAAGKAVAGPALHALAEADAQVKRQWIEIIRSHIGSRDRPDSVVASQLLGAVLRCDDKVICEAALDVLLSTNADWSALGEASEMAQLAALDRLGSLPESQATRLLYSLSRTVRRAAADRIATFARSVNLSLADPHDSILTEWPLLTSPGEQLALAKVLNAIDLGDLVYSQPFGAMVGKTSQLDGDERVRNAVLTTLVDQVQRRLSLRRPPPVGSGLRGQFPVLVSQAATDSVVAGLTEAVRSGDEALQLDALALLLYDGFTENAARGLLGESPDPEKVGIVLRKLMAREDISRSSGLLAFLGRCMNPRCAAAAPAIFSYLDRMVADNPGERSSILAAVKSGVDFEALDELIGVLDPSNSAAAIRWLCQLAHLTPQERERLSATRDPDQRSKMLNRTDLRRAQLVDGRYGAVLIVETTEPDFPANPEERTASVGPARRWRAPDRTTVTLDPLEIRSDERDETYRVYWDGRLIGRGAIRQVLRKIRRPASFSPMLATAPPDMLGPAGWGWPDPSGTASAVETALGPAILPGNRPVQERPSAGTMKLNLTAYLRAGLAESGLFATEDMSEFVPESYEMTLRYAVFGSYYGVAVTRPLPRTLPSPGRRHLLNVMLILERMD